MPKKIEIEFTDSPSADDLNVLSRGLTEHSLEHVEKPGFVRVAWFHRDEEGNVDAGIFGSLNWNWANVFNFWVSETLRGKGIGTLLMTAFEEYALANGCEQIHLDTFSFQAPSLYEAWGYERFATIENYPSGHARYFYRKRLTRNEESPTKP